MENPQKRIPVTASAIVSTGLTVKIVDSTRSVPIVTNRIASNIVHTLSGLRYPTSAVTAFTLTKSAVSEGGQPIATTLGAGGSSSQEPPVDRNNGDRQ